MPDLREVYAQFLTESFFPQQIYSVASPLLVWSTAAAAELPQHLTG